MSNSPLSDIVWYKNSLIDEIETLLVGAKVLFEGEVVELLFPPNVLGCKDWKSSGDGESVLLALSSNKVGMFVLLTLKSIEDGILLLLNEISTKVGTSVLLASSNGEGASVMLMSSIEGGANVSLGIFVGLFVN